MFLFLLYFILLFVELQLQRFQFITIHSSSYSLISDQCKTPLFYKYYIYLFIMFGLHVVLFPSHGTMTMLIYCWFSYYFHAVAVVKSKISVLLKIKYIKNSY